MAQGSGLLEALARQRVGAAPTLVSTFPQGRGHIQSTGLCGGCGGFGRYGCCGRDEATCSWTNSTNFQKGSQAGVCLSFLTERGVCADHHKPLLYRGLN